MQSQREVSDLGGTMRLGAYTARLRPGSKVAQAYGTTEISERHRHRWEVNNAYRDVLAEYGLRLSGQSPDGGLVEIDRAARPSVVHRLPVPPGAQVPADPPASAVRRLHRRRTQAPARRGSGRSQGAGGSRALMGGPRRAALFAFGVAAVAGAAAGCGSGGARPTATVQAADTADQVIEGFSHYVTADGIRKSRVEADTAYFYEASQLAVLRHLRATFYDPRGAESSTLTADRGTYRWQDGSMDAQGSVVVTGSDGRQLKAETLKFDPKKNEISTDQAFRFEHGTEFIQGTGFSSDPDFKNVVTNRPHGVAGKGVLLPGQK